MRWIAGFVLLLPVTWLAVGQAPAPATPTKIAVVNTERALASTAEGKTVLAELDRKFSPQQKQLQANAAELDKLQADYQQKQNSMSDAERQRRAAEIQQKQKVLDRLNEDVTADFNAARDEAVLRLTKRVTEVAQKFGAAGQYLLILDSNAAGAMYVGSGGDITNEIVAAYDKQFPLKP